MASLFGRLFGRRAAAAEPAAAPAPAAAKRAAESEAAAPGAKKAKAGGGKGGLMRRVSQLRDLRGRQALMFTCPTRQERKAAAEAFELLEEYAERQGGGGGGAGPSSSSGGGSLADALAAEAASAQRKAKVQFHDIGSQGICYATVDKSVDVVRLCLAVLADGAKAPASPAAGAKFMIRVMPMQTVNYANLEGCLEGVAPLVQKAFGGLARGVGAALLDAEVAFAAAKPAKAAAPKADDDADFEDDPVAKATKKAKDEAAPDAGSAEPRSYAVVVKRRNADAFPKDIAIRAIASLVPPQHAVDLKAPDVTIVVEVFKSLCGLAVVPSYAAHHNFNLHAASGKQVRPPNQKKPAAAAAAA